MRLIKARFYSTGGFTLLELLVVISVISLLASVVLASLNQARSEASDTAVKENVRQASVTGAQEQLSVGFDPSATSIGWVSDPNDCDGIQGYQDDEKYRLYCSEIIELQSGEPVNGYFFMAKSDDDELVFAAATSGGEYAISKGGSGVVVQAMSDANDWPVNMDPGGSYDGAFACGDNSAPSGSISYNPQTGRRGQQLEIRVLSFDTNTDYIEASINGIDLGTVSGSPAFFYYTPPDPVTVTTTATIYDECGESFTTQSTTWVHY